MTTNRDMHCSFRQGQRRQDLQRHSGWSKPTARAGLEARMLSNRRYTRLTFPRLCFFTWANVIT